MSEEVEDLTLFVRGMNKPSEEIEDIWDDTILNNAYDKALQMANVQVAKRIAMETNTKKKDNKSNASKAKTKPKKETASKPATPETVPEWKPGMPCQAMYEEDGLEYEAIVIKLIDDDDCVVKFLGYDNTERVAISSLKPSLGNEERMRQLEAAGTVERGDDGFESRPASEDVGVSDSASAEPVEKTHIKKKKSSKSSKKKNHSPRPDFGDLPTLPMPTMNMFRNLGADMSMPMPPPPLATLAARSDAEEQAISDMLLSWYMTGYYTGLYQGMKRQRQGTRHD